MLEVAETSEIRESIENKENELTKYDKYGRPLFSSIEKVDTPTTTKTFDKAIEGRLILESRQ